jgi:hypothetical protein
MSFHNLPGFRMTGSRVAQMDFIRHMAPELLLALFLVCMSGALVAAAYITSR